MKKRVIITLSGDVQDPRFRVKIRQMAQDAGLVGYVSLRHDGRLNVICEGAVETVKEFIKELDIHGEPIDVGNIEIRWSKPMYRTKYFCVKCPNIVAEMFWGFESLCRVMDNADKPKIPTIAANEGCFPKISSMA